MAHWIDRATPLAQARLDGTAPRQHYGRVEVAAARPRTALTRFDGHGRGAAPAWSLNPYIGCQHACVYCYVPKTIHHDRAQWGAFVQVKEGLLQRLRAELRSKAPATVYLSTATDAYQPVEQEHRTTRHALELLARHDWPVDILTRSPLVLRDLDVLGRFSQVRLGMSIPTLDDDLRRLIEPGAPPIQVRLDALRALSDAGIETYANHCPSYPPTVGGPEDVARTLAATGARWVNANPMEYLADVGPYLYAALPADRAEWLARVTDPRRQAGYHEALRRACARYGMEVHRGFFNRPFAAGPAPTAG